jgi:hypothetical protein
MLLAIIAGCEIGFWVVLLAGLTARYLLGLPRVGAVLLVCVPLIDLVLLVATIQHLRSGATADFTHGLAAAYIGVSVAFGPSTIRWADARFAHRFAGGPPPPRPRRYGRARARYEWQEFGKALGAWAISCALLVGGVVLVGDATRTAELLAWIGRLSFVLLIWLIWPVSYTLWPSRPKAGEAPTAHDTEDPDAGGR